MIIFFIGVWRNLRAYISIRGHRLQMSVGTLTYTNLYFKTDSGYNRIECAFKMSAPFRWLSNEYFNKCLSNEDTIHNLICIHYQFLGFPSEKYLSPFSFTNDRGDKGTHFK